jgi:ribonuclease P protein component
VPSAAGSQVASGAASGRSHQEHLRRSRRITGSRDIRTRFQRGKRSRTAHLDVFDSASPLAFSRAGVVVPKHRHGVVERNRLKRRLRDLLRRVVLPGLETGGVVADVLVRARPESYEASYETLRIELSGWVARRCSPER